MTLNPSVVGFVSNLETTWKNLETRPGSEDSVDSILTARQHGAKHTASSLTSTGRWVLNEPFRTKLSCLQNGNLALEARA